MHVKKASVFVGAFASAGVSALPGAAWQYPTQQQQHFRFAELGPRPEFLVNDMDEGWLKDKLLSCADMEARPTKFSIGHRGGACLQFPEESRQSIEAGTRMGAGILECDVAFTSDRQLVCRHDQCDLHTTTNIVATELGAKCTTPFTPASGDTPATANCCTSDITLAEFKTLCGKMDGFNASATTPEDFLHGTPGWRTDLYATCGTVLSHKDFLTLVDSRGRDFTTELKEPRVPMPFQGNYTQEEYAQQVIKEYRAAGIDPSRVWLQSFSFADVAYWLRADPAFGKQAILLDESGDSPELFPGAVANLSFYKEAGVQIVAPPLSYLVTLGEGDEYIPSSYATTAKKLGLKIITWSLERSGPLAQAAASGDYYWATVANGTHKDGDMYRLVDVLAREIGVQGIFSDWSATVTYYANCFGLF
ncbi:glycerophosphoryl diester phosphodiesterase family protein [Hypoxylon trugodes]|uniref:glycerophosphoryl diester phosphodiesterase family protein n=1 Tax=Hypoxylon trugodes TaxID=326681 RepID=UPI00218C98C8|nr:glycerophosphoryl diester phosphodiesterase family protein [Hypoxylon trugodes]KAI1393059.1 glycerophosphoryl diester phosphodiesterase family protein [Hypoxylon trugodes]